MVDRRLQADLGPWPQSYGAQGGDAVLRGQVLHRRVRIEARGRRGVAEGISLRLNSLAANTATIRAKCGNRQVLHRVKG